MAYATEIAKTLTETLHKFATLESHKLAGHAANLSFWLDEIRHCVQVLDGYHKRFEAIKSVGMTRVPESELKTARREVLDAGYHFLVQCYKNDFFDEAVLRQSAESIGTGIDLKDLHRC